MSTHFRRHWLLGLLCAGTALYFFANIQRVAIPGSVFNLLQAELGLPAQYITALGAAFMYVYALNQLFVGLLVDRWGGVRTMLAGGVFFLAGEFAFPLSHSPWMLYFSRALTGFGAGTLYLSLVTECMRLFRGRYNLVLAVIIMVGYAGGILANAPFSAAADALGLRPLLLWIAAGSALFYLAVAIAAHRTGLPPVRTQNRLRISRFGKVLGTASNRWLFLFSGVNFGLYYVIQTVIGKKFLEDYCSLSGSNAGWTLSGMGLLSAVSGLLFALLSRRFDNRRRVFCRISGTVSLTAFSAMALLLLFDCRNALFAGIFCVLALTASLSSIVIPLLKETNPDSLTGCAVSFLNFSFYLAVAVFGNAVGLLMNLFPPELRGSVLVYSRSSYLAVFLGLLPFAALVFWGSWKAPETFGRKTVHSASDI